MSIKAVRMHDNDNKYDCAGCVFEKDMQACIYHTESCIDTERERKGQPPVPGQGGRIIFIKELH